MMSQRMFRTVAVALAVCGLAMAQAPGNRAIGVVTKTTASGVELKTDAGEVLNVQFAAETKFQRVAPGEKTLANAQPIQASDVSTGDRVLARGPIGGQTLSAQSIVVMSGSDLAKKREQERLEWTRRGVAGLVVSTNEAAQEIRIRIPAMFGEAREMTVATAGETQFHRYAPDSVKFSDARPGKLSEIRAGDQLRALGDRSEDGTRMTAQQVVTGSFRTVAAQVLAVRANELDVKDLESGATFTIAISPEATVRRMPPFGAGMAMGPAQGMQQAMMTAPTRPVGPSANHGGPDMQAILERMPRAKVEEVQAGAMVVAAGTRSPSGDRFTAITLLTGADPLINMLQARAQRQAAGGAPQMGAWNLSDVSSSMMSMMQ